MSHSSFVPFCTFIDTTFWAELNRRKLHEWRLDETPRDVSGQFSLFDTVGDECRLSLNHESFERQSSGTYHGRLILLNTLENFKGLDRKTLLLEETSKVWGIIESGEWLLYPERLVPFVFTVYADLKKFHYYFWNCFPALCFPENIKQQVFSFADDGKLMKYFNDTKFCAFLLDSKGNCTSMQDLGGTEDAADVKIVFADPSPVADCAGWPLRNLVAAVAHMKRSWRWCSFVSLKGGGDLKEFRISWDETENSMHLTVYISHACPREKCHVNAFCLTPTIRTNCLQVSAGREICKERWSRSLLICGNSSTPRSELLIAFLFPQFVFYLGVFRLMEQSVELNLSLIKWRLVPEMKLERYTSLKVLIFGAGTLGSNIARCLLAWGVKKITFVDNSFVSYSNPVAGFSVVLFLRVYLSLFAFVFKVVPYRQSLSEFADAREARGKAETAAAALRRIYPSVEAEAVLLTVPMPGHTIGTSEETDVLRDVETLEKLVSTHDVVFLALDSREARWLPTVLASKHGKMAFSVALGFDNYVVIRHGVKSGDLAEVQSSSGNVMGDFYSLCLGVNRCQATNARRGH
ncbi:putative E1-like protein-activating enzyme Gsa7p/Apg7p [Teladorsagia circumcincta]|uniref:Putative E1-like protein-activating enzyme Gsa7p/Apg7p n=1 Tax=Teladorsagia circumcincta TaxID=45464 RepID=A0A2G9V4D9_TELCI|nr:putative E1-like protein-activating enzyme Gsa7p/Apg7p [Teladorsagia circumcincta]